MNSKLLLKVTFAAIAVMPFALSADPDTPGPDPTRVETQLRVDIDKDTEGVHFIQTDNDPDMITKTYVLKHADPYELRPYLRGAIGAERITGSTPRVECVKYNDGTGVLIVSAEDYKFDKTIQNGGMTIDDIIEKLDQPKITSSSGKGKFLYFPKYRTAADLQTLLQNVGFARSGSTQELLRGKDEVFIDSELNAMWFYVTPWSIDDIKEILAVYDAPLPEVKVAYKVFEINNEDDDRIGMDWQAWKNGPGTDLLSLASRYSNGWDFANSLPGLPWNGHNAHTKYVKFSPRWNTRFLDLLAAKGKASVLTNGTVSMINGQEGRIEVLTQMVSIEDNGNANADVELLGYARYTNVNVEGSVSSGSGDLEIAGNAIEPVDMKGYPIDVNVPAAVANQDVIISRVYNSTTAQNFYYIELDRRKASQANLNFVAANRNLGTKVRCTGDFSNITFSESREYVLSRDNDRETDIANLATAGDTYGYQLRMVPSICGQTTTVDLNVYNTSLIGYQNDGNPRTERSEFNTTLMVANDGSRFVVGGIDKKSVVKSTSKIPWLGSIPGLGWLLGSEGSVGKTSRIVTVLECVPVTPESTVPGNLTGEISTVNEETQDAGIKMNSIGFDQFLIDKDKKKLDPLP